MEDDPASLDLKMLLHEAKDIIKRQNEICFLLKRMKESAELYSAPPDPPDHGAVFLLI